MLSSKGRVLLEYLCWSGAVLCFLPLMVAGLPRPSLAAQTQVLTEQMLTEQVQTEKAAARDGQTELHSQAAPLREPRPMGLAKNWKTPVMQDWSAKRRESFLGWLTGSPAPVAVLEFPQSGEQVAVFAEESERAMTLGASYLDGLQNISDDTQNVALSSHRDGPFRQLRFVKVGDVISLYTPESIQRFRVRQTSVVSPEEVNVLDDNGEHRLTLITCYPFYFVGSAPRRFIVEAIALDEQSKTSS